MRRFGYLGLVFLLPVGGFFVGRPHQINGRSASGGNNLHIRAVIHKEHVGPWKSFFCIHSLK